MDTHGFDAQANLPQSLAKQMIERLTLKFGPQGSAAPLTFSVAPLNVFVGPNNSGKSLILQELEFEMKAGVKPKKKILERIEPRDFTVEEVRALLTSRQVDSPHPMGTGSIRLAKINPSQPSEDVKVINLDVVLQQFRTNPDLAAASILQHLVWLFLIRLDGATRLNLTSPQALGDLLKSPQNHLAALFQDSHALETMRGITYDAFGLYFVIDPTDPGKLRIRLSTRRPVDLDEEQSLGPRAREFHRQAVDVSEFSDGIKAYTGLTAAVLCSDFKVMLIDEPEAFLHPPLIRRLGRTLAELASKRGGNVFVSTHSSEFVMGAVQSGVPVNIVRLTFRDGVATARLLAATDLQVLMRDPLLRSTGVLTALFHEGGVVGEGDQDRAFYQEINERLLTSRSGGADNCLFLNAHNKHTLKRLIRPLREMGIPAAAITDIDFIKGDGHKELLEAAFVPQELITSLGQLRGEIFREFERTRSDMKQGGIDLLGQRTKESAESYVSQLSEYGIFVVPHGEVESWLPELGVHVSSKGEWLPAIFERMGTEPNQSGYVYPSTDGVWDFVRKIASWINDPLRKGMPLS